MIKPTATHLHTHTLTRTLYAVHHDNNTNVADRWRYTRPANVDHRPP